MEVHYWASALAAAGVAWRGGGGGGGGGGLTLRIFFASLSSAIGFAMGETSLTVAMVDMFAAPGFVLSWLNPNNYVQREQPLETSVLAGLLREKT